MTTYVVYRCDECGRGSGVARLRDDVDLQGWVKVDGKHLCPDCAWMAAPAPTRKHWQESDQTEGENA